ncbi:hypothetical protein J1N35_034437 [Gossypium stocksii]|uniref:Peptidase A2 domain-containing protein n=1 Tax=Gossypium stocksii TaxID=47602 RepID=A0A9D3US23_9ROSI|nr:hypothetical protein J1N35_034437 [Gossypium stocksii]
MDNRSKSLVDLYEWAYKFAEAEEIKRASRVSFQMEDGKPRNREGQRARQSPNSQSLSGNDELIHNNDGNDPMVVSIEIVGFEVKRILVDSGSTVKVLSSGAYKKMSLKEQSLSIANVLYGFVNYPVKVRGTITLPITLGDDEHTTTKCIQFYLVDHPIAYNAIFGRPIMRMANIVMVTYCMKIKFRTNIDIGFLQSTSA